MNWKDIQKFFRDNPRAWIVGVAAVGVLLFTIWGIWGGFSLGFSRFFAAEPPSFVINNPGLIKHGEKLSVSWAAGNAQRCDAQGWFSTGGANQGTAESDPVDACAAAASNQVGINCTYADGQTAVAILTFGVDKSTCPTSATPTPVPGSSTPPSSGGRVDPSGACVWRVAPNAANGGWFCNNLNCPLLGNPPNLPPAGPASQISIKLFRGACGSTAISTPYVGCDFVLDSTPRAGGLEAYPAKDPLWSCTGPFDLGRNGADFFDCYNPRGRVTGTAPITCCANTGLSGDCFTFTAKNPPGGSVPPSGSTPPSSSSGPPPVTPTPVFPLLVCSPANQTVALRQNATVTAVGGDGVYQWSLSGSGIQQGGTSTSVDVSYSVAGQKVVRVSSAGQIATCAVTVTGTGGTAQSPLTVIKLGSNAASGNVGQSSSITINPNEIALFTVSITNNGGTPVSGIRLLDMLPTGMSYRFGSTTVDGQVSSDDEITTGGLALDNLEPGANTNIQWSAVADVQLAAGPQQSQPQAVVTAADIADTSAFINVTVFGGGFAGTPVPGTGAVGGVATGPGEAVTIALVLAAALTLLYSGYTRSAAYRRHDADVISRDQGPMDFRS